MHPTHHILDHIAGFTALRDLELLEFSLLKSINGFLKPLAISVLKLDGKKHPRKEIEFKNGAYEVRYDEIEVQYAITAAIDHMDSSNSDHYTTELKNCFASIHMLHYGRRHSTYMILNSDRRYSKVESYIVSGMLQIYRNFYELLIDAQTDQLTGLANRKTFDDTVGKIYEVFIPDEEDAYPNEKRTVISAAAPRSYWLALIDIDFFKKVNDTYGHLYGDEVLVLLSHVLRTSFREDDFIFRFGGEEFVVLLRATDQDTCSVALERFRKKVEETKFPGVGTVTVSLGTVEMDPAVFHITLLDYADQALYHSKQNGRNRITFFGDLVAENKARLAEVKPGEIDLF